jgi:hypothetical protein
MTTIYTIVLYFKTLFVVFFEILFTCLSRDEWRWLFVEVIRRKVQGESLRLRQLLYLPGLIVVASLPLNKFC